MKDHVRGRGQHTTLTDAAVPLVRELSRQDFDVSADFIESKNGASGSSTLNISIHEWGLELKVVGNCYTQKLLVYTHKKRQAISLLISLMGGRKAKRVRIYKMQNQMTSRG